MMDYNFGQPSSSLWFFLFGSTFCAGLNETKRNEREHEWEKRFNPINGNYLP